MLRTGVDLLDIDRLRSMKRDFPAIYQRFLKRVFTPHELLTSQENPERLAGLFAAKEAASKALQCGIGAVGWQSIEVQHGKNGEPFLVFSGEAQRILNELGFTEWSVSISDTREQVVAVVVLQ